MFPPPYTPKNMLLIHSAPSLPQSSRLTDTVTDTVAGRSVQSAEDKAWTAVRRLLELKADGRRLTV